MGSIPLKLGDAPSERLKGWRVRHGGAAQLRHLLSLVVDRQGGTLAGIEFTLRHRAPRDLEAIERALVVQLADVENTLAHVRNMIHRRDMPVSALELSASGGGPGSHGAELQQIIQAGAEE